MTTSEMPSALNPCPIQADPLQSRLTFHVELNSVVEHLDTDRDVITLAHQRPETTRSAASVSTFESAFDRVASRDRGADPFDVTRAYDEHGAMIYRFALNAVGDRGMAEECVQETFTRAWRARNRYDPSRAGPRTWLFAIARNVIKDAFRRRARTPVPVDDARIHNAGDSVGDPNDSLIMVEALATLSSEHRQAVVAIHLVGVSYAELSDAVDVPVATLRSRTFYGLRALRRHFEGGEDRR